MLLCDEIEINPSSFSKYYENLGYVLPKSLSKNGKMTLKRGTKILVKVMDLPKSSPRKIGIVCDNPDCSRIFYLKFSNYILSNKDKNHFLCSSCYAKSDIFNEKRFSKRKSFYDFLVETFGESGVLNFWNFEKNNISPKNIRIGSNKKIWINCLKEKYHVYETNPVHFGEGKRCPYCSGVKTHFLDSVGYIFPKCRDLVSDTYLDKNFLFELNKNSNRKFLWKCENGLHDDYSRTISKQINRNNFSCPECVRERKESFLQEKVRLYLEGMGFHVLHEKNCKIVPINPRTGRRLFYDNEVQEIKLIIEVMGEQHSRPSFMHGKSENANKVLEYQQYKDNFKKEFAIASGYDYLDIWYYDDDDIKTWKTKIDNFLL